MKEPVVYNVGSKLNDANSSWWCGKSVAYKFCNGKAGESCGSFTSGAGSGRSAKMGRQDQVSSVYLYPYDPDKQGAVTLFENDNCIGLSAAYMAPDVMFESYSYPKEDMERKGMPADHASSVMIPYGY